MRRDKVKEVRISAPAAMLTFEEGASKERLSLSLKSLSKSVLGEEDPLLTEYLRVTDENRRFKQALEDMRDILRVLESEQPPIPEAPQHPTEGVKKLCDNCGQPIDPVRLKNLPQANLCLSCKVREEKKAKDDKRHKQPIDKAIKSKRSAER